MSSRLEQALAARLREVARAKKIPLSHVADRAGLARSYLWSLLNSTSSATLAVIQRIADALAVEPLDLLRVPEEEKVEAPTLAQPKPRPPPIAEGAKPKKKAHARSTTSGPKRRG